VPRLDEVGEALDGRVVVLEALLLLGDTSDIASVGGEELGAVDGVRIDKVDGSVVDVGDGRAAVFLQVQTERVDKLW
jgi:hypothetical protein